MRSKKTKILSFLLSAAMILTMFPAAAQASDDVTVSDIDAIVSNGMQNVSGQISSYAAISALEKAGANSRNIYVQILNGSATVSTFSTSLGTTLSSILSGNRDKIASITSSAGTLTASTVGYDAVKDYAKRLFTGVTMNTPLSNLATRSFPITLTDTDMGTDQTSVTYTVCFVNGMTHVHDLEKVEAKDPTCEEDGNIEHWKCKDSTCGKLFKAEDVSQPATEEDVVVKATGHELKKVEEKAATCGEDGTKEYYECSKCGKMFADAEGKTAIDKPESIPKTNKHKWGSWKTTTKATISKAGKQQRTCSICEKKESRSVAKLKATIKLSPTSMKLKVHQSTTALTVKMAAGDSVKSVSSSNTKIVKASKSSSTKVKITAQGKTGSATVKVTLKSGKKASVRVTVQKSAVKTTKISGVPTKLSIKKGKSETLKPTVSPVTSKQKVTYKTSNKKVATVSSKGVIKGVKKGTATITVTSGSKKVTCKVTVK